MCVIPKFNSNVNAMFNLTNYPIYIKLPTNKDQFPDNKTVEGSQDLTNVLYVHYPYLLNKVKMYWEDKRLSWRQKWMYKNYPFQEIKNQDGKTSIVWNEIVLSTLPLQLALLRNGLDTFQTNNSEAPTSLVYLNYGSIVGQDVSTIKIHRKEYLWRLFLNNEEEVLYACTVCSDSDIEKAKDEYQKLITSVDAAMFEINNIESIDYLLNAIKNVQDSLFAHWMDSTFARQLKSWEELTDIIDHCYDEIKETRITAWSYHQLFRWFGEVTQQIGYNAYDIFARDRNGVKAWELAVKQHLDAYELPEGVADAIFFNHIKQILKFQ